MDWSTDTSLIQGTPAWLSARQRRIGGSDIAAIMGVSPYKTRRELWEEKVGVRPTTDISGLPHVRRGIEAEPIARAKIEEILAVKYTTPVIVGAEEWMVASLDGLCEDHTLEIKTMSLTRHRDTAWGWVPEYYRMQVQWGLMISGRTRGMFASYRPEDGSLYWTWIALDEKLCVRMHCAADEFYGWVQTRTPPPDGWKP